MGHTGARGLGPNLIWLQERGGCRQKGGMCNNICGLQHSTNFEEDEKNNDGIVQRTSLCNLVSKVAKCVFMFHSFERWFSLVAGACWQDIQLCSSSDW